MYSPEEMVHILRIRAKTECLSIEEDALTELGEVGSRSTLRYLISFHLIDHYMNIYFPTPSLLFSLILIMLNITWHQFPYRYAVQLLTPANLTAKINGRTSITVEDIKEVGGLFLDAKSSAKILTENKDRYMKWTALSSDL